MLLQIRLGFVESFGSEALDEAHQMIAAITQKATDGLGDVIVIDAERRSFPKMNDCFRLLADGTNASLETEHHFVLLSTESVSVLQVAISLWLADAFFAVAVQMIFAGSVLAEGLSGLDGLALRTALVPDRNGRSALDPFRVVAVPILVASSAFKTKPVSENWGQVVGGGWLDLFAARTLFLWYGRVVSSLLAALMSLSAMTFLAFTAVRVRLAILLDPKLRECLALLAIPAKRNVLKQGKQLSHATPLTGFVKVEGGWLLSKQQPLARPVGRPETDCTSFTLAA